VISVRLLAGAEADFTEAAAFFENELHGLGARFTDSVQRSLSRLADHPLVGTPLGAAYRKLRVHGFPYNVIYRVEADAVLVVAVAHHRRKPGYWRSRS
jgi:toxin ParE1/3/4